MRTGQLIKPEDEEAVPQGELLVIKEGIDNLVATQKNSILNYYIHLILAYLTNVYGVDEFAKISKCLALSSTLPPGGSDAQGSDPGSTSAGGGTGSRLASEERVVVGVNAYQDGNEDHQVEILQIPHQVEVDQCEVTSASAQASRQSEADAASRAGEDDDLALEVSHLSVRGTK